DGGRVWRKVYSWEPAPMTGCCLNIVIDPVNSRKVYTFLFGNNSQLLASSDVGDTWERRTIPSSGNVWLSNWPLCVDPSGSGTIGLGLARSDDGGARWKLMATPPTWTTSFTRPDPRHPGWVYAATAGGTGGKLFRSEDGGATWKVRNS